MNSDVVLHDRKILEDIWQEHCRQDSWNLFTVGLHNGDLYFIICLIKYLKSQAKGTQIRIIADTEGKFALLSAFESGADFIGICSDLARIDVNHILRWCTETGRGAFAPGSVLLLHPFYPIKIMTDQFHLQGLVYNRGWFNLVDLFKVMLRVPLNVALKTPPLHRRCSVEAKRLFDRYGLEPGQTVICFPYAITLMIDTVPVLAAFAELAAAEGMTVCSAVHGQEIPIPGTRPIQLTFDTILPFCELAGYVVTARSGIADMLSATKARKVNLYRYGEFALYETPVAYGLGDCSYSEAFEERDVQEIAASVLRNLHHNPFEQAGNFIPHVVMRYLERTREYTGDVFFRGDLGCRMGRYILLAEAVLAEGWSELEEWGIWSIGYRSICYFRMPEKYRVEELGLVSMELHLDFAVSDSHPELRFSVELNGRTSNYVGQSAVQKICLALTETEKEVGFHRLVFDIDNPLTPLDQSGGTNRDDRLIGIGLRRVRYLISPGLAL